MSEAAVAHELALVNAFIAPHKRERYSGFVRSPKARPKFIDALHHLNDIDLAAVVELPHGLETPAGVLHELRRLGASGSCYLVSVDRRLDQTAMELEEAISRVVEGTIVSCIPGRLAWYEGEPPKNRFILFRR